MILKKKNRKIKKSIDFTEESIALLDEYKEANEISSYSDIVNFLVETFMGLNKSVKEALARNCEVELREFEKKLKNELPYERAENKIVENQYVKILNFFNDGKEEVNQKMKRIDIQDGYVIFPSEWIVIFEENAINSKYAGVVEVKNGSEYNSPHFLFLSEKPINQLSDEDINNIDKECTLKFPAYKEILKDHVPLIYGENNIPINIDEHLSSPIPGYFAISDYSKSPYSSYPCGAMIFRNSKV